MFGKKKESPNKARLDENRKLFSDAVALGIETPRVPILSNNWGWKIHDAGYKYSQALYSHEYMLDVITKFCNNYKSDSLFETGIRNPFMITRHFGSDELYIIDEDKFAMSYKDVELFKADEYDAFIKDPMGFIWSTFIPRKCYKIQNKENGKAFADGINDFLAFSSNLNKIAKAQTDAGMMPAFNSADKVYSMNGVEILFNYLRGIKGLSVDIRRIPEKVKDAALAVDSLFEPKMDDCVKGHSEEYVFDGSLVYIAPSILSMKQFGEFINPYLQKNAAFAREYDKKVIIFAEANTERFYDYFRDLPVGHYAILPETNDVIRMKKELPNICAVGGMPSLLLGTGSKEQCIDKAKELIDIMAPGGGYIFSEDKMLTYPADAKSENLKATYEFVQQYRR